MRILVNTKRPCRFEYLEPGTGSAYYLAMRALLVFFLLVSSFALTTPGMAEQAPNAAEVIDRVVAAYGGRERLTGVRAYRLEAKMHSPRGGEPADITRIIEGTDGFAVMLRYPSRTEIRVLEAGQAWRGSDPAALQRAEGPPADAIVLQATRVNIVRLLDQKRDDVRVGGTTGRGIVLDLDLTPELLVRALIDDETNRVTVTQSFMRIGDQTMQFQTHYSDFREVEGVYFAFHEEKYAGGMHMGSIDVDRIEINPKPDRLQLPR